MIKRIVIALVLIMLAVMFLDLAANYRENTSLSPLGRYYAEQGPAELGAANLVTAVVVTYRGLDTLGEVTVLFIHWINVTVTDPVAATQEVAGRFEKYLKVIYG
jgi:multicomponent Na+:H+ antiporter subunit B